MLAHFSSKDKQTFFNIKPTVIDKLISKNKSSIQNSLLYTNEDSDVSVTEDSENSSSSSRESNLAIDAPRPAVIMAPVRKRDKDCGVEQKVSSRSQMVLKRGPGRPPKKVRGNKNLKVIAAKMLLESSKGGTPKKKIIRDLQESGKIKRDAVGSLSNRARSTLKKEYLSGGNPSGARNQSNDTIAVKPLVKRRRHKEIESLEIIDSYEINSLESTVNAPTTTSILNTRSSPRKFPTNVMDRWKSTGFVIRGRGRGRGRGTSRGSLNGRLKRERTRSERYNTRDSQTGLMRSGKKRKCSDSVLVEGLERVRRRRKISVNHILREKLDCPSDEQSSFVTTSELSFCENENSLKQSDEESVNVRSTKIKIEEEEDETKHSTDTNSNVFVGNKKLSSRIANKDAHAINQSNNSKIIQQTSNRLRTNKFGRGRKRRLLSGNKIFSKSDPVIKESDSSMNSEITSDSTNPTLVAKRQRRKGIDWVRRSTRSVGKTVIKVESDNVGDEDTSKNADLRVDLDSNSKSSFNIDDVNFGDADSTIKDISKQNEINRAVIQTPIKDNKNSSFVEECIKTDNIQKLSIDLIEPCTLNPTMESILENDSKDDFSLILEDTPVKDSIKPDTDINPDVPRNLVFNVSPRKDVNSCISIDSNIGTSTVTSDQDGISACNTDSTIVTDNSHLREISDNHVSIDERQIIDPDKPGDELIDDNQNGELKSKCPVDEKSGDIINDEDRELISDEKILSMIDSFCHSDSNTNLSEDELQEQASNKTEKQSLINDDIISEKTNEDITISKPEEQHTDPFKTEDTSEKSIINASYPSNELKLDLKDDCKFKENEGSSDSTLFVSDEICENAVPKAITECSGEVMSKLDGPSSDCSSLKIESCFNNKMDVDIESTGKAPESSEESSSDTNSNMSELMSNALETDAVNRIKEEESLRCSVEENRSGLSVSEGSTLLLSTEPEAGTSNQSSSFCSFRTVSNNEDIAPSRTLLNQSNMEERPSIELLSALGLQSLHSVAEEKPKRPNESYTGTLKAVIKLNRSSDKKGRKIIFKQADKLTEDAGGGGDRLEYRICSAEELSTEGVPLTHLGDFPNRKLHLKVKSQFDLSNSPNIMGASGSMDTPSSAEVTKEAGGKQNLVIPEKSSSFSIHPERLCTDVCSYCFGKFGSLDTPCHLAQLKNSERQSKILAIEVHLSVDSCLCDGCFRYVDRKANCPASQRSRKPAARRGPLTGTFCAVQDCTQPARHSVRRKWLIKLKKSIGKKLVIDMDKNPHLPFPLCSQHYYWVDYFTVCGICKKRLTRNHMYALGPEADALNHALSDDGIPVRLSDKLFLCKLCRYYSSLRLKYQDPSSMTSTHRLFLNSYRKKILRYHDIPVSDSDEEGKCVEEENGNSEPPKPKKKKSKTKSLDGHDSKKRKLEKEEKSDPGNEDRSNDSQMIDYSYLDTLNVHREETPTPSVDYNALRDFDSQVGFSNIASLLNPLEGAKGTVYPPDSQNRSRAEKPTRIQVKFGNLNIGKLSNLNIGQDTRPSSSVASASERPPFLPGERELNLAGEFEFHGALSPSSGWERCTSTIQFDRETKKMWQELQRPYGNQSSFLRHLVILEKHWRNGSLVFTENPSPRAVKYINSVRNRVQAYDGAMTSETVVEKPNKQDVTLPAPPRPMSTPLKTTSAPPPLMKISPSATPWLNEQLKRPPPYYPTSSTSTMTTHSRVVPVTPPPPYRFPCGPRTIKLATASPTYPTNSRGQQNIRPASISYQQFKRIRLEKPSVSSSQVVVTAPKIEAAATSTATSSSKDFAPLICDVRSLASSSSSSDWNESFRQQQQKMLSQNYAKYYTPILPRVPNSLTVTTFPQTTALVMKTTSLTIEKAPSDSSSKPIIAPPEKPSISVFRETTSSENS